MSEYTMECVSKPRMSKEMFVRELERRVVRSTEERHFYEGQMKAYEWVLELINDAVDWSDDE